MIGGLRLLLAVVVVGAATAVLWVADGGLGEWRERLNATLPPSAQSRAALTADLASAGFARGASAFLRIFKRESEIEVWLEKDGRYELFRTYPICRWSGALGPKLKEGDRQAPEGFYTVSARQLNPNSRHHLSFDLGFPNAHDRALGRTGSFLMVHGGCSSAGCYALTDRGVDDVYRIVEAALKDGQTAVPVHAFPFRMTPLNRARFSIGNERWLGFWDDLQAGYDAFEGDRRLPRISVADGRYVVAAGDRLTKR